MELLVIGIWASFGLRLAPVPQFDELTLYGRGVPSLSDGTSPYDLVRGPVLIVRLAGPCALLDGLFYDGDI